MREEMPRWVNGFFAFTGGLTLIGSVAVLIAAIAQSIPDDPASAERTWVTAPGTEAQVPPDKVLNEGTVTFTIETNRGGISMRLDRARHRPEASSAASPQTPRSRPKAPS
jgi:hypothetical protein